MKGRMVYKENPKTAGSGILCAIPQAGTCPNKCDDCFFQSGRSYLEPLDKSLPNMPHCQNVYNGNSIVRVNDGNDSNVRKEHVETMAQGYPHKFYNTAIPKLDFDAPVVLTVNPDKMTDTEFHDIDRPPKNLMFVRFRVNTWNVKGAAACIDFYTRRDVAVVLTFMAYHDASSIPVSHRTFYIKRKRFLNSYYAITTSAWRSVMRQFEDNKRVYSCGKIEGELGDTHCRFCGNCLCEYFAARCRMGG